MKNEKGDYFKKKSSLHFGVRIAIFFILGSLFLNWLVDAQLQFGEIQISDANWTYANLRALDTPDFIEPSYDLIAVYFRQNLQECRFRLDFLASATDQIPDAYFFLDFLPGGQKSFQFGNGQIKNVSIDWDILIHVTANDNIQILGNSVGANDLLEHQNLRLLAVRDIAQDTLEIRFQCEILGFNRGNAKAEIVAANSQERNSAKQFDDTQIIFLDGQPPQPANVALYFYQTFEGKTPAQALKHWNGAHTGPNSTRHGLFYLIEAVKKNRLPVILADLKTPQNLSALSFLGVLPEIIDLEHQGFLILPDYSFIDLSSDPVITLPDKIYDQAFAWSRQVSSQFGLNDTYFFSASEWPLSGPPADYMFSLPRSIQNQQNIQICKTGGTRSFCGSSSYTANQEPSPVDDLDEKGLTIDIRKLVIDNAMRNRGDILLLGGDLERSSWGNINSTNLALRYIKNHPWIRPINGNDLLNWGLSTETSIIFGPQLPKSHISFEIPTGAGSIQAQSLSDAVIDNLSKLPENEIATASWQAFYSLLSTNDPRQHRLNAASLGQIGYLAAAARWVDSPSSRLDCGDDLNFDGLNECVVASDNFFTCFEMIGGSMTTAFAKSKSGISQIAASSYQIASGISDPFRWIVEQGVHGDPDAPGAALVELAYANKMFTSRVEKDSLILVSEDGKVRKIISLKQNKIRIEYQLESPQIIQLQTLQNPWDRFHPNWLSNSEDVISTNMSFQKSTFWQPLPYLNMPEDPNLDYGRGYFVLFPFEVYTFQASSREAWIEISTK